VVRGPAVETPFALVPVLYITDRQPLAAPQGKHQYFGGERIASGVSYGRVLVRMPAEDHTISSPVPSGVRIVYEANAHAGVSVPPPESFSRDQFTEYLRKYKQGLPTGAPTRVLLFVHGFNVTYADAVKSVARLSFGLHVDTVPVALTWPSQGAVLKYWNDEQNVETSIERLRPVLLWLVTHPDIDEVILVAHSMGARLVIRILSQLDLQMAQLPKLTRVALAAADLNEPEIRGLWTRIHSLPAKGWLFYTSANDFALLASAIVHANPPVGDSRAREFILPPVETIDASAVAPRLRGYGHGYVTDNPLVRVDLRRWFAQNLAADRRGLTKDNQSGMTFWRIHN
jgi:esterase/lipase superfamily enzyme